MPETSDTKKMSPWTPAKGLLLGKKDKFWDKVVILRREETKSRMVVAFCIHALVKKYSPLGWGGHPNGEQPYNTRYLVIVTPPNDGYEADPTDDVTGEAANLYDVVMVPSAELDAYVLANPNDINPMPSTGCPTTKPWCCSQDLSLINDKLTPKLILGEFVSKL